MDLFSNCVGPATALSTQLQWGDDVSVAVGASVGVQLAAGVWALLPPPWAAASVTSRDVPIKKVARKGERA